MKTLRLAPLFGALLFLGVAGCASTSNVTPAGDRPTGATVTLNLAGTSPSNTVVENAMAVGELSMLVDALQRAGLADQLSSGGPYTVFAPTNDAFARADIDMSDTEALSSVLLYHVAEGEMGSGNLNDGTVLVMMGGGEASVSTSAADPLSFNIDDADIVHADIESSNGVIHVINLVLNPVPGGSIDSN